MTERVLLIDDDADLLRGLERRLRRKYDVTTAVGGEAALDLVRTQAPYAVAVSDMRMPGLSGLDVLQQLRKMSPDTQRIMLTGNLDQETAINAVNQGSIFRFFTKPCAAETLAEGIDAAIRQYQIITVERDLLEKTLAGSVKVLTDILALAAPNAFRHSARFRDWARSVREAISYPSPWQLEIAAMLSPIGQVTLPAELAAKWQGGESLNHEEREIVTQLPAAGKRLIGNIPRMQDVAEIVYYQDAAFDGSGFPGDGAAGSAIPLGARVLKIFKGLDAVGAAGPPDVAAFARLSGQTGQYDPELLERIQPCLAQNPGAVNENSRPAAKKSVSMGELREGDVLEADIYDTRGSLLLAVGSILTDTQIEKMYNLKRIGQIKNMTEEIPISRPNRAGW